MSEQIGLPYVTGSDTSKAAAEAMAAKPFRVRADHQRIINVLLSGPKTDNEGMSILGMSGSSYRPRRGELVRGGRVRDSGARKDGSTLWELVP